MVLNGFEKALEPLALDLVNSLKDLGTCAFAQSNRVAW